MKAGPMPANRWDRIAWYDGQLLRLQRVWAYLLKRKSRLYRTKAL